MFLRWFGGGEERGKLCCVFLFGFVCFGGGNEIREDDRNEGKKKDGIVSGFGERKWGEREKRGGWG